MLRHAAHTILFAYCVVMTSGVCAESTQESIPESLKAPTESKLLYSAEAKGVQIYVGVLNHGKLEWKFDSPRADLVVGNATWKHYAGPTWEASDASKVKKSADPGAVTSAPAPNAKDDVPWLLIKVQPEGGKAGLLDGVRYVQRVNTKGGAMPTEPPSQVGARAEVKYSAEYLFYGSTR